MSTLLLLSAIFTCLHAEANEILQWQDCRLLSDVPGIVMLERRHEPDPILIGQPYNITRRFKSLLDVPIQNLTEAFSTTQRTSTGAWEPAFSRPPFGRCGKEQYQTRCPLAAGSEFSLHETHPRTHVSRPGQHRSVEHYYADGVYAGCAVVVYSYAAPPGDNLHVF